MHNMSLRRVISGLGTGMLAAFAATPMHPARAERPGFGIPFPAIPAESPAIAVFPSPTPPVAAPTPMLTPTTPAVAPAGAQAPPPPPVDLCAGNFPTNSTCTFDVVPPDQLLTGITRVGAPLGSSLATISVVDPAGTTLETCAFVINAGTEFVTAFCDQPDGSVICRAGARPR